MGKAWPDKCKREDDPTESIPDDQRFAKRKQVQDLFSLVQQLVKNTNPQKENQGKGCQGDSDRGSFKERDNYRRQGCWDSKQEGRDHGEQMQYANTAAASGQK